METCDLVQGTDAWKKWRKSMVGASDASSILGIGFQTPNELWEQKMGFREEEDQTTAMSLGIEIEDAAREFFLSQTGIKMTPKVVIHEEHKWMHASLDGISDDGKMILEIKRVKSEYHEMARSGNLPEIYYPQIQHQLSVTGLNECFYLSYRKDDCILLKIQRNDDFIRDLIHKELEFKNCLDTMTPPPLSERDYIDMSFHEELSQLVWEYDKHRKEAQSHEMLATANLERIKEIAGEKNIKGQNFKITKYMMKGRMNYEAVIEELLPGYNLEVYRKEPKICYRVSVK